jgi:hypothetical protein
MRAVIVPQTTHPGPSHYRRQGHSGVPGGEVLNYALMLARGAESG